MADAILLSDSTENLLLGGGSRYVGPYVLASQLEQSGFDVAVIDYFTKMPAFFEYLENFLSEETLFVGISSTFLSRTISREQLGWIISDDKKLNYLLGQNTSRSTWSSPYRTSGLWLSSVDQLNDWLSSLRSILKRRCPMAKIVLGGAKAANLLHEPLTTGSEIDFLAISASDFSILDFARSLANREEPRYFEKNGRKIIDNLSQLQSKVCPETVLSKKLGILPNEALPIEISRGCAFNCKFCHYEKKESIRKPLHILRDEFIRNYELFGTTVYTFCDDCFNDSRQKVEDVCGLILGLPFKIEWVSYARVDVAVKFPETMDLMIESGAKGLFFGLESFNPIVAKKAGKGTPSDKVKEFLVTSYGRYSSKCLFEGSFVVGLPGETPASQRSTIQWTLENPVLDFLSIGPLTILPYDESLDKVAIDYADYARNPKQHGFKKTSGKSKMADWEHETMNSSEALSLVDEFVTALADHGRYALLRTIWNYPTMRTLGFTPNEIHAMARDSTNQLHWCKEIFNRRETLTLSYWNNLERIFKKVST